MDKMILALDQSSQTTGWAVFKNNAYVSSGTFTIKNPKLAQRLLSFRMEIANLIEEYGITEVIYEDIQLQANVSNNVKTFKALAEIIGVLTEYMAELKIPCSTVLASVWKSKIGIKGKNRAEEKKKAQEYVIQHYQKELSEDECDAICIGTYAISIDTEFSWD